MREKLASVFAVASWSLPPTETRLITPFPFVELAMMPPSVGCERLASGAVESVQAIERSATAGRANHAVFMRPPGGRGEAVNVESFRPEHGGHNERKSDRKSVV